MRGNGTRSGRKPGGGLLVLRRAPHRIHPNAEAGRPDATIRAQVGHISTQVAKRYSHIRRQELNRAAAALEPHFLKNALLITPEIDKNTTIK